MTRMEVGSFCKLMVMRCSQSPRRTIDRRRDEGSCAGYPAGERDSVRHDCHGRREIGEQAQNLRSQPIFLRHDSAEDCCPFISRPARTYLRLQVTLGAKLLCFILVG